MLRLTLLFLILFTATTGCDAKKTTPRPTAGSSIPVLFEYENRQYNGTFCKIVFDDQSVQRSAIVFSEKSSSDSASTRGTTITVDHDGKSRLSVDGKQTFFTGRPLILLSGDGSIVTLNQQISGDLESNDDTSTWCLKVFEETKDEHLQSIIRRCGRSLSK